MFDSFVDFLKDEAGDSLRAVGSYEQDEYDIHYLRASIDPDRARARAEALHNQFTWDWAPPDEPALDDFGELIATVSMYPNAVIIHFPLSRETGVVTTLDADVAKNLHDFTNDCLTYLESHVQNHENP